MDKLPDSPYLDVFRTRAGELVASLPKTSSKLPTMPEKVTSGMRPFDLNVQNLLKYLKEIEKVYERSKVQEARRKVQKFRTTIKSLQQLSHKRPELFIKKESFDFSLSPMTDITESSEEHQQFEAHTPTRVNGAFIVTPETLEHKATSPGDHQDNHETSDNEQGTPDFRPIIPMRNTKRQPSYLDQVQPMVTRDTPYAGKFEFAPVGGNLSTCFKFGADQNSPSKSNDQKTTPIPFEAQTATVATIEAQATDACGHNAVPENTHEACGNISLNQEYTLGHVFVWSQHPVPNGDEDVLVNDQTVLPDSSHEACDNVSVNEKYTLGHVFVWSQHPVPNGDEGYLATIELYEAATDSAANTPDHSLVCNSTEQTTSNHESSTVSDISTMSSHKDILDANEAAQDLAVATSIGFATEYVHTSQSSVEDYCDTEANLATPPQATIAATDSTPTASAAAGTGNVIAEDDQVVEYEDSLSAKSPEQSGCGFQEAGDASGLDCLFDPSDAGESLAKELNEHGMLDENDLDNVAEDEIPLVATSTKAEDQGVEEEETLLMATRIFLPPSPVSDDTLGGPIDANDDDFSVSDGDDSLIIITEEEAPIEEVEEVSPASKLATTVTCQSPFTSTTEEYTLRHVFPHTGDQAPPEGDTVSIVDHGLGLEDTPNSPAASADSTLWDDQSPKTVKFEDTLAVSTAHLDPKEMDVFEDEPSTVSLQVEAASVPNSPSSSSERIEKVTTFEDDVPKESTVDVIEIITENVLEETEVTDVEIQSSVVANGGNHKHDATTEQTVGDGLETSLLQQENVDVTDVLSKADKVQSSNITAVSITRHSCATLAFTTVASLVVGLESPVTAAFMLYAGIAYAKYQLYH
ncbi:hypothetical protein LTS17_005589 [Exophiala oligosperma]